MNVMSQLSLPFFFLLLFVLHFIYCMGLGLAGVIVVTVIRLASVDYSH